jgi:phosphatidylglycerophosphate synthase
MDRERLRRLRNFQSDDFYPALVIRPLTIAVLWFVADWRILTPNRLTSAANVFKLAAVVAIVPEWASALGLRPWPAAVAAVVLLHLGLLFDMLDGTLARYRRSFTTFGSFYDKASDTITWTAISTAVGWLAYRESGHASAIVVATASSSFLAVRGYMKYLAVAESEKLRWHEAADDPAGAIARRTAPPRVSEPPSRDARAWVRWAVVSAAQIYRFEEMDLPMWVSLGILLGRVELLAWLLFVTQLVGFLGMVVRRHREAHGVDLALARRGTSSAG